MTGVSAAATTPTLTTTLSATSVGTGASVHDTAVLTNATNDAAGTVVYTAYNNGTCDGTVVFTSSTKTVTADVVPNSDATTFANAGSYSWKAVYTSSNEDLNGDATSACEPLTVVAATATPTTNEDCVLRTTKDADVSEVPEGGTITYTIKVKNIGTNDNGYCTNLDVTDVIPDDTDCTSATVTSDSDIDEGRFDITGCDTSGTVEWYTDDNLDTGNEVVIQMAVVLTSGASDGDTITNEACADSDTAANNDCDSTDVDVTGATATATPAPTATTGPVVVLPTARPVIPSVPVVVPTAVVAPLIIPSTGSGPDSSGGSPLALALGLTGGALLLLGGTGVWLRRRA